MAGGIDTVTRALQEEGFYPLSVPLRVAGLSFQFDGALIGTRDSHDLVLLGGLTVRSTELAQLLASFCRMLDHLESRRPVTLVILGPTPDAATLTQLTTHARVIALGLSEPSDHVVRDRLAILFPIDLPPPGETTINPMDEVKQCLSGPITAAHVALIDAASQGQRQVCTALRDYVAIPFRVPHDT